MLDRSLVGRSGPPVTFEIEKGHIARFADAIGDDNPVYRDEAAAHARGYASVPAPPTFPTALRPPDVRAAAGIDYRRLLHGEQSYELGRPIVAGDRIEVTATIVGIGEKTGRSGTWDTVEVETRGVCARTGARLFVGRSTSLIRREGT